jgi:hypothetical protein
MRGRSGKLRPPTSHVVDATGPRPGQPVGAEGLGSRRSARQGGPGEPIQHCQGDRSLQGTLDSLKSPGDGSGPAGMIVLPAVKHGAAWIHRKLGRARRIPLSLRRQVDANTRALPRRPRRARCQSHSARQALEEVRRPVPSLRRPRAASGPRARDRKPRQRADRGSRQAASGRRQGREEPATRSPLVQRSKRQTAARSIAPPTDQSRGGPEIP